MKGPVIVNGVPVPQDVLDRFLAKVDNSGGPDACWPWTAKLRESDGYGQFSFNQKILRAHRVAFLLFNGDIPEHFVVDHLCHDPAMCRLGDKCPHRACVNPRHLRAVTSLENTARGAACVPAAVDAATLPRKPPPKKQQPLHRSRENRVITVGIDHGIGAGYIEMTFDLRWLDLPCDEAQRLRDAVWQFEEVCKSIAPNDRARLSLRVSA